MKTEKDQKPTQMRMNQFLREVFLRPSFSPASVTQAPFKYLYNPQNHYKMAETRKPKSDKGSTKKFKEKINSSAMTLESRKPEIIDKTEKVLLKSSHKTELLKESTFTSETNSDLKQILMCETKSINSKETLEMDSRIDYHSMDSQINDEATCCMDNPNTDPKKTFEDFSASVSECINSSNIDLVLLLNEVRAKSTNFDEWSKNYSQNNAKKPLKKGGKKEKGSDPDSGESKDAKKEGKKKEKKETKKKDKEYTDGESGDSKDGKKEPNKNKKEKMEVKEKDTESTDDESGDSKDSRKEKRSEYKIYSGSTDAESTDSKVTRKEKRSVKKDDKKGSFYSDSETDAESKKVKRDGKNGNRGIWRKPVKGRESTDADSESEGDPTGMKGEKKDKKITKKGEKKAAMKNADSTASGSDFEVKKEKKKASKDTIKSLVSYTDSGSDSSSREGTSKIVRPSDTESEESSGLTVMKTTDDSDITSTDSTKEKLEVKRGFRISFKKTTFREKGKRSVAGRIHSSRERLVLPPCEPVKASSKPKPVCQCKASSPPPKPRYAPLVCLLPCNT
ncbi:cylicin-1 [Meriones unguiculatus]|uniref:cylicin-1 n=1 Tax=Meriones unguiculatus TaxID=10047 RepID=UPI00293E8B41|nr:cylicin-1 [Meriones unguiculatus]